MTRTEAKAAWEAAVEQINRAYAEAPCPLPTGYYESRIAELDKKRSEAYGAYLAACQTEAKQRRRTA